MASPSAAGPLDSLVAKWFGGLVAWWLGGWVVRGTGVGRAGGEGTGRGRGEGGGWWAANDPEVVSVCRGRVCFVLKQCL